MLPADSLRFHDGAYFPAGVFRIEIVHHILKNGQHFVVVLKRIHAVVQRDEPAIQGRKDHVDEFARFDVIPPEAAQVFDNHQIDLSGPDVGNHGVQAWTVEGGSADAVIHVGLDEPPALFLYVAG